MDVYLNYVLSYGAAIKHSCVTPLYGFASFGNGSINH